MLRKALLIVTAFFVLTLPSLAQFPPPGIYVCSDGSGNPFSMLSLFVAGDYDFVSEIIPRGQGQLVSSGSSVNAPNGPLADIDRVGSCITDDYGDTVFDFQTSMGTIKCALPLDRN